MKITPDLQELIGQAAVSACAACSCSSDSRVFGSQSTSLSSKATGIRPPNVLNPRGSFLADRLWRPPRRPSRTPLRRPGAHASARTPLSRQSSPVTVVQGFRGSAAGFRLFPFKAFVPQKWLCTRDGGKVCHLEKFFGDVGVSTGTASSSW